MKRIIIGVVLVLMLSMFAYGQGSAILPYMTQYIRTLLNDPDAATARTTLGLGTTDSPAFTNLILTGYGQLAEIATPPTPDSDIVRFYAKDDGEGTSRYYILDDAGLETDLTGGGGGATTLDALLDVSLGLTPYTDGKVLRADGDEYVDAVLDHTDLTSVGSNAHSVIDSHLASTANPHTVTAAQAGAVALTGNETIAGIKTFSSFPILPSSSPTTNYQAVHKAYVDAFAQSLEVKLACRIATTEAETLASDFENGDTIDAVELATGNRILIKNQADATTNGIYTVNASDAPTRATDYDATAEVQEGTYTFITEGTANNGYQFVQITKDPVLNTNDLVFTYLNKPGSNTGSLGVELVGNDLRADLLAAGALGLTGNELKVNVDDSSIEIATNALQVKAAGITNAMLAGSIADSKLSTISTASKVDWVAVNKTGSVLDDIADVVAPAPSDDQALAWDDVSSKWIPQTISGAGGVNAAISDIDVYSSGTVDAKWTNMPVATTELFGNTSSRVKLDLTYGTHYRIVVTQTVAGSGTADFNLQYSTDNVTYQAADTAAAGELNVGAGTGVKVGSWAALVGGANADVWLRIVGKQGNAKVDPVWRQIRVQFKMLAAGGTLHNAVTIVDSQSINLTLATQQITADVNDKDYGDVTVSSTGSVWAVDNDSHDHSTTTVSGLDISADTNFGTAMASIDLLVASGDGVDANTATPANGDTKHLSTGDQIYDWVVGLSYLTTVDISANTNLTAGDHITLTDDDLDVDDDFLHNNGDIGTGVWDFGGATTFEIHNSTDPDLAVVGQIAIDSDGANEPNDVVLRSIDGGNTPLQIALAQQQKSFQCTVVKPNDFADATRDAFFFWENSSGMSFVITKIRAWSNTDNTTVNVETVDSDWDNNATVDALEIATNEVVNFSTIETVITAPTIVNGSLIIFDFDDTDDPGWVKFNIMGYFLSNVD